MKEILQQVKKIEISTKKLVDGLISGNYHSVFKGSGVEFSEIREYYPGDDIRSIDWNVTARFNKPYVKNYIEERDLRVYFVLDISGSLSFGNTIEKRRKSIEIIASLMFSALKNNDAVGLFLITENIELFIPVKKGRKHILKILAKIISFSPRAKSTNLKKSLEGVSKIIKRRGVMFIISDFLSSDFSKPLKILKKRNDIIAIRILDKREKEIPKIGYIQLEDEETGEQILLDTSNNNFREKFHKIMKENDLTINNIFKKYKIDCLNLFTDEDYEKPLKKFFKIKKLRSIR